MATLAPDYLAALAQQFGFLAAFLGGFAATFFAQMLAINGKRRLALATTGLAAAAAVGFIVTVAAATSVVAITHPSAPVMVANHNPRPAMLLAGLSFTSGMYALLASIGISGWLTSRRLGWTTSILAGIGAIGVTSQIVG